MRNKEEQNLTPEDQAANDFQQLAPKFKQTIFKGDFSRKSLARVFYAAIVYPLEDKPKFQSEIEELAFAWALHLIDCKYVMIRKTMEDKLLNEMKEKENGEKSDETKKD